MAAKKGNKNAIGNSGGKEWGKENREKAATLKGLSLDWMIKVMNGKDEKLKKEVVLKIATTCLPQVIQGDSEAPLFIQLSGTIANKNGINIGTGQNSTGLPPVQSS
jgi:hypothetical protein